jgi:hypothetical protein
MQAITPARVIHNTNALYGILWDFRNEKIVPIQEFGRHPFSDVSKLWKFVFGEGCVGRAYARHETIVLEIGGARESSFLRKNIAEDCGVRTIAFKPQDDGSVLEVGFDLSMDEMPKNWWVNYILGINRGAETATRLRIRTPSPRGWAEYNYPLQSPFNPRFEELNPSKLLPLKSILDPSCSPSLPRSPVPQHAEDWDGRSQDTGACSVGSFGHPFGCAPPCKYITKKKGCKEATACPRCHLCIWTRSAERAVR